MDIKEIGDVKAFAQTQIEMLTQLLAYKEVNSKEYFITVGKIRAYEFLLATMNNKVVIDWNLPD